MKEFANVDLNTSNGGAPLDQRGPWNNAPTFDYSEAPPAVDGGSGLPELTLGGDESKIAGQMALSTQSDPTRDATTGAELGATQPPATPALG